MSHRDLRVSTNRSKLQRLYYGSDLDEPTPSASGTWLSPLRHTNRGESSDTMEETDACKRLKETDVVEGKTVRVPESITVSGAACGISTPSAPGATSYHAPPLTTRTNAAPAPRRASPPPPASTMAGAYPPPDPSLGLHSSNDGAIVPSSLGLLTPPPPILFEE